MSTVRITESLAYRIHRLARGLRKNFLELGRRAGVPLTPEQWFILNKLAHEDGQSQVELGESIFADRPNITRMVQSMEEAGFVRRREDEEDRRKIRVFLSDEGRRMHDAFAELVPGARATLFRGVKKEELAVVERVLAQIEANLG